MNTEVPTDAICHRCRRKLPADAPDSLCPYCLLAMADVDPTEDQTATAGHFQPPSVLQLQEHFHVDQLKIIELHGRGGMGAVYRAHQSKLSRDVAIKILPPELAMAPGFDERFQREAQVLARLDHNNIVDVYDFGKAGPYSYLTLEFVEGVNLRELIAGGEMSPTDALQIVPQLCDALQFAHDASVVHRDVKPENILINLSGRIKITDFGLAKLATTATSGQRLTRTQQAMGTPQYMAPEQIERPRDVDHRADIYALGVVFYELLTGELPLGRFDPPSTKSNTSRRLDRIVLKTLEKNPDKRFDSATQLKTEVEKEPRPVESTGEDADGWADQARAGVAYATEQARAGAAHVAEQAKGLSIPESWNFDWGNAVAWLSLILMFLGIVFCFIHPAALVLFFVGLGGCCLAEFLDRRISDQPDKDAVFKHSIASKNPASRAVLAVGKGIRQRWHPWGLVVAIAIGVTGLAIASHGIALLFVLPMWAIYARWRIHEKPLNALSDRERWLYYPPIVLVVSAVLVVVVAWPVLPAFALCWELLPRRSDTAITFAIAGAATAETLWLSVFLALWGKFPSAARFAMKPLISDYNGGGTYVLAVMSLVTFACLLGTWISLFPQ